ncbi:MAG: hypothetical protein AB7G47_06010 [Mycolicibacterium sp.]|uniref:hypothetical protein n=1 Tax=Mycolicibacterium sp. TaxID=2320850 RepID=UPI003D0C9607
MKTFVTRTSTKSAIGAARKFTIGTATAAAVLSAAAFGSAASALAAPSGGDNAADTIRALEADGHRVIVRQQSNTPLAEADVVAVRTGAPIREWTWDLQRDDRILETVGYVVIVETK